jgi:exodeoxyribonuclease VII small subunit
VTRPAAKLEHTLARLDEIVAGLEREDLQLDEALRLFEEGVGHLRAAQQILASAELKIARLVEARGQPQLEPMNPAAPER